MQRHMIAFFSLLMLIAPPAKAAPTIELIEAFVAASVQARQPDMRQEDLEHYLSFMSDDVVDYHAAYDRSFNGKSHLEKGIPNKAASMISMQQTIEHVLLGSNTAVVVVNEASEYIKDGEPKLFLGRTILVLEFDSSDSITHMRRYLD